MRKTLEMLKEMQDNLASRQDNTTLQIAKFILV